MNPMKMKRPEPPKQYSAAEIASRRDKAIERALRTPPTHLKDIPKKRTPKPNDSSKRGED